MVLKTAKPVKKLDHKKASLVKRDDLKLKGAKKAAPTAKPRAAVKRGK
jgi:hypothetical protein